MWMDQHMQETKAVRLNALGLDRINKSRIDKRQPALLAQSLVSVGEEPQPLIAASLILQTEAGVNVAADGALPSAVDNAALDAFPGVRSQLGQGSCAAFSSTYYVGSHMTALARAWPRNTSDNTRKLSPKWTYALANGGGDNGCWFSSVLDVMLKLGVPTWSDWPYTGMATSATDYLEWPLTAAVWRSAINYRFSQIGRVGAIDTAAGLTNAKALLNNGYLLLYATNIYGWQFTTVGDDTSTTADDAWRNKKAVRFMNNGGGPHGMTIVGYNDDLWIDVNKNGAIDTGERGALRIVNSWGTNWGNGTEGFCWISYDALRVTSQVPSSSNSDHLTNRAGSGSGNSYMTPFWGNEVYWITARSSYSPTLLAELTLSTTNRGQMGIRLGRSATTTTTPSAYFPTTTSFTGWQNSNGRSQAFQQLGGAWSFAGTSSEVTGTFVLDATDLAAAGTQRYYLEVSDNATNSPVSVSSFRLLSTAGTTLATATTGIPLSADASTARASVDYAIGSATPTISSATTASGVVGQSFSYTIAGTNSPTSFAASGLPAGLSLNTSTGAITGTSTQNGSFTVSIAATNSSGTGTGSVTVQFVPAPIATPVISSSTSASGTVGQPFTYTITASNSPTSFAATNLPTGLSLNTSSGVISGTPTAAGTFSIVIAAANGGGSGSSRTLALTVASAAANAPVITSSGTATGVGSATFTYRIEATNSPTSYGATDLPTGLTISSTTGVISGTLPAARSYVVTLRATNAGGSGYKTLTLTVTGDSSFAPANDALANGVPLNGTSATISASNVNARAESGEPAHAGFTATKSIWYSWTAPSSGTLTLDTIGSAFDTVLAVYTGSTVGALTSVASNDDGGGSGTSRLTATVTGGATYRIAIDGKSGAEGVVRLNLSFAASSSLTNNAFSTRTALTGTSVSATGSNIGATAETGEPGHAGYTATKSVWWSWTAPSSGRVAIDTIGSNFDTLLAIYTGTNLNTLTLIASDDESGGANTSRVIFNSVAGTTYQIAVDGWQGATGAVRLNVTFGIAGPANDNFSGRTTVSGTSVNASGSNVTASAEIGEPDHHFNPATKSVWWTWKAPASGRVTIDTIGSGIDTVLGVYTGTSLATLLYVTSDDDSGGGITSRVSFRITSGTVYQIAVDGWDGVEGRVKLNISVDSVAPPANDNFSNRATLMGSIATATGSSLLATTESGEPRHSGFTPGNTLWWAWTAPQAGRVTVSTAGSDFDTILAVYTGTSLGDLVEVASNDDSVLSYDGTSEAAFYATAGTTYAIVVGGYSDDAGTINLSLVFTPSNDIYFTDFEAFNTGSNALGGTDQWKTTNNTDGSTGIFLGFGGTSKTAWIGFNSATESRWAWRPINYNPAGGTPEIRFQVDMSIRDSTNGRQDLFSWLVYNTKSEGLCLISFDNATGNIWRYGAGTGAFAVGTFTRGTRYTLMVTLNFAANRWSAWLGDTTLFIDKQMTTTSNARNLGYIAASWGLATTGLSGDNYMVFDNYRVSLTGNDSFASATTLSGTSAQTIGTNSSATKETGEPNHAGNSGGRSVWWRWVAPSAGIVALHTRYSTYDTLLAVYTGSSVGSLTAVASNDNEGSGQSSALTFTATSGTTYWIAVDGWNGNSGTIVLTLLLTSSSTGPVINQQPAGTSVAPGSAATFSAGAQGGYTYRWQRNGTDVTSGTSATLTVTNVQPNTAGLYQAVIANSQGGQSTTQAAILGVTTTTKLVGPGTEFPDIFHAGTGFTYDQILLAGGAASVKADAKQILRMSFVDLNNDIVQVEFAGAGTLSLVLDGATGPAEPMSYSQATTYMKGHAGIVVTGADETSNLSVFSVGRANAVNQALFRSDVTYDGHADISFIAIQSPTGKFGGLRTANARYFATKGYTGLYAPGIQFTGPVFIGDVNAYDNASPVIIIGSGSDTRITGGDLLQSNGRTVAIAGLTQLRFVAGTDSHGNLQPAQTNRSRLEQNGAEVTTQVVVNP